MLEVLFDLLEGAALGFRKEEGCGDEVDDGAGGPEKKHGVVTIRADDREEDGGDGCGDTLVDEERDPHAGGTDAGGHELGEHEPNDHTGAE